MNKRQLKTYERLLNKKIDSLIGKADSAVGGMSTERETFPDPTDQAAMEAERNFMLRVRDRERKLILKARSALARIESGNYGYCDRCGEQISDRRLKARPEATMCIECKRELEDRERQARLMR